MTGPTSQRPAAIVLTGGQSRRMGTDKAGLVVNGVALVDHVRNVLVEAGVTNIVIAGLHGLPDPDADPVAGGQGPLAGIVSGWSQLHTDMPDAVPGPVPDPVIVLSCDLPGLTSEVITALVEQSLKSETGAVADDGERLQPLIAAYRPAAVAALVDAYAAGERSVRRCFDGWDLVPVRFDDKALRDADIPEDLAGFDVVWPDEWDLEGRGR